MCMRSFSVGMHVGVHVGIHLGILRPTRQVPWCACRQASRHAARPASGMGRLLGSYLGTVRWSISAAIWALGLTQMATRAGGVVLSIQLLPSPPNIISLLDILRTCGLSIAAGAAAEQGPLAHFLDS